METLITIGVVIYIILSIRKALSFGKDGTKKPAKGGWQDKLQEMARQIKEEMEKAQREAQGLPPAPPPLPPGDMSDDMTADPEWEDLEEESDIVTMEESVNEEAQDLELDVASDFTAEETGIPAPPLPQKSEHAWDKSPVKKRHGAHLSRKNLKQALIWSEILAKPLSLRE